VGTIDGPVPPFEALPAQSARPHWWTPLLWDGIRPLVLAGDVVAGVSAILLTGIELRLGLTFCATLIAFQGTVGLYKSRLSLNILDDLPRMLTTSMLALSVTALAASFLGGPLTLHRDWVLFAATATTLLAASRVVNYGVVRRMRASRLVAHRTLVVGAGGIGRDIAENLLDHPEYGLDPIGFLESPRPGQNGRLPLPLLGQPQDLPVLLRDASLRAVVLAYGRMPERDLVELIRTSHRARCDVFVVPRLYEIHNVSHDMESVWGTPLVRLRRAAHHRVDWPMKRCIDIAFSLVALLFAAPVMLLCALAVYREGGPGVIFRQERVGCDGRRFMVMKFRTLRPVDDQESQTHWNVAHDDRLGRVGRLLRKTSLDELPQLLNVLRGDMSLVGPRPERPHFVEEFQNLYPSYRARERVPCGLTGWAQIHGLRGDTSISDRARFDNFYIENWSLWLDIKIMLRTTVALVRSPGA
jgi:exopolysaccharide biosynthesis polyprenyl glycosylphosphotransferase